MKNYKKVSFNLLVIGLFVILLGITYAFFNFISVSNELVVENGQVYLKLNNLTNNGGNIVLSNCFPETPEHARARTDNYLDFSIIGKNTYEDPLFYTIKTKHGIVATDYDEEDRMLDQYIRFDLYDLDEDEYILSNVNYEVFDNYEIYCDSISESDTNYERNFRIRVWYDEDIIISDTDSNADFRALEDNPDENPLIHDKPVYSTLFSSVKVEVYGDYVDRTPISVMKDIPSSIDDLSNNITEIHFIKENQDIIDQRYAAAYKKGDVTYKKTGTQYGTQDIQEMDDFGKVLAWIEPITGTSNYKMYIGSEEKIALTKGNRLFYQYNYVTVIDFTNATTKYVTDMKEMFYNCSSLTSLDLSNFNTKNVTTMYGMFDLCSGLTSLDLSSFNTSNVTTMYSMFSGCSGLTSLDLSNFNTSSVTDMKNMFSNCRGLTTLDLSNFNTSNVTTMYSMFNMCSELTSLNVSSFNTSKVTTMEWMFAQCTKLATLDITNFDASSLTNTYCMFAESKALTSLDLSNFNTINVTNMNSMFLDCWGLTSLDLSGFDTRNVTDMGYMFDGCIGLLSLDLSNFNTSNVTIMNYMFYCCKKLTSLNVTSFNTSNVTNMSNMFSRCNILESINVNSFNTSNVTNMSSMFEDCKKITSLDLSSFNTSSVTDIVGMFKNCTAIVTIYVGNNWNIDDVILSKTSSMFYGCKNIKGGSLTEYNASYTNRLYAHVDGGTSNPGYLTLKSS